MILKGGKMCSVHTVICDMVDLRDWICYRFGNTTSKTHQISVMAYEEQAVGRTQTQTVKAHHT